VVICTKIQKADCAAEISANASETFFSRLATCMVIFSTVISEEEKSEKIQSVEERMAEMRESLTSAAGAMTLSRKIFTMSFAPIFLMEKRALVTF
jgi:hypothetical protein